MLKGLHDIFASKVDATLRVEALKVLIAWYGHESAKGDIELTELVKHVDLGEWLLAILEMYHDLENKHGAGGRIVLEAVADLQRDACSDDDETEVSGHLVAFLGEGWAPGIRAAAAACLGHSAPFQLLRQFKYRVTSRHSDVIQLFVGGIRFAIESLCEIYDGPMMCQGKGRLAWLQAEPDQVVLSEYSRMRGLCAPVIRYMEQHVDVEPLRNLLRILNEISPAEEDSLNRGQPPDSPGQLHLPF